MRYIVSLLLLLSLTGCRKTEYVIDIGEKIYHHGVEYSVSNIIITRFIREGSDTIYARGMFYLVDFKVENKSRRTDISWDNSIAYITDERAGTFESSPEVQRFYNASVSSLWKETWLTPPGSSDSTWLAFDLPFNTTRPYLKIRGKPVAGDLFDGALFRRVRVKLP
ncbi:MAG TPA: hypothetical protein PLV06_12680 [Bacteroidales bacterium]|nr:hypothetical protein [Bacteroidales bacterium]HPF04256.1 hypothetical protein [Bacteroidales bacterium]HPJ59035.1 hypothetical protein [Bacteroidales bacterium]HPR13235.1 hypothetical protein [Bacteroidales bacterium]HRW84725.1 hypothetical protein [Bacteroidales bacterium]